MRILHAVELYAPSVGGAQEVVRQVSERLAARGHEVTVATSALPERTERRIGGVEIAEFDVRGNEVRGIEGDVEGYRRFVADGGFDVVMTYAAQQWTTDALLPVLDSVAAPKVLAPCGFSGLHDPAYAGYFERLPHALRGFDELIFHSGTYRDIRFAREHGVEKGTVIPNAADEREFGTEREPGAGPALLTVGGHTGLKGHAEAMDALRASTRARTLAIVGNTPTGRGCLPACRVRAALTRVRGDRVLLLDPPRDEVIDLYFSAELFVFCSLIECSPLVLFEAMAAGLPFVSVDVGNAREIAEWSGGGVIVPRDPQAVARAVDELLADPDRRRAMGESGRAAWRERFTWEAVAQQYEAVYERVAA